MKISDLAALLSKVQQIAGDVDVVLEDAQTEASSVITDLGIHLDPSSGVPGGTLTIQHGQAPPAPPSPAETPAPVVV